MNIRPALYTDCAFVYYLAMDQSVRAASTREESFTYEEHCRWWDRRFDEPTTRIWIAEEVGYVRYGSGTPASVGEAEVAIAVAPAERGRGAGRELLTQTEAAAKTALGVDRIKALVRIDNIASQRLFESAGYQFKGWVQRMGKQHRIYVR